MNEKEVAEIRRRFRIDTTNIMSVRGCYVNEFGEVVSEFDQSIGLMTEEETELLLSLLRKSLSGSLGKNLTDIEFDTNQVVDGEEHGTLMKIRQSELHDDDAVHSFYQRVANGLTIEGSYMILLAHENYDVPHRTRDDMIQKDLSEEVYSYIVCAICPLKLTKPALTYYSPECKFKNISANWIISSPELGFLFPSFDDRSTNIYGALYYTKNLAENHQEFVSAVFNREIQMPSKAQKQTFQSIIGESVAEDCSLEVVHSIHSQLAEMITVHKESKEEEPLKISVDTVKDVLKDSGVPEPRIGDFESKYDEYFGEEAKLNPASIIDTKQFEVTLPDVVIKVSPDRGDLIRTTVIDGTKYLLIRADEGVEVNGVTINIQDGE